MTPKLIVAWRLLGARREAADRLALFSIVQHAMHADKKAAQEFVASLRALAE